MSKTISIVVPCYNEIENVRAIYSELTRMLQSDLSEYDYNISFIDNCSTDGTQDEIRLICSEDDHVKAIINARNFGATNSAFYGLCQAEGDCAILFYCDFQDPVDVVPRLVEQWEQGYKVVCAIKAESDENPVMRFFRTCYYKLIRSMSADVDQIEQFTGFGLYDRSFIEVMKDLDDPTPFLRGIVAELAPKRKDIEYHQAKRKAGKSHFNFFSLYDAAMLSFTSYTKIGMRVATLLGFLLSAVSVIIAVIYCILKLLFWDLYPGGTISILLAVVVFGSLILFFIGLLGEYVMSINARMMERPLVIEEERINY